MNSLTERRVYDHATRLEGGGRSIDPLARAQMHTQTEFKLKRGYIQESKTSSGTLRTDNKELFK